VSKRLFPELPEAFRSRTDMGHFTLARTLSDGRWQAAFRVEGEKGWHVSIKDDPVEAILDVLNPTIAEDHVKFLSDIKRNTRGVSSKAGPTHNGPVVIEGKARSQVVRHDRRDHDDLI
jgi:hypothetical protein